MPSVYTISPFLQTVHSLCHRNSHRSSGEATTVPESVDRTVFFKGRSSVSCFRSWGSVFTYIPALLCTSVICCWDLCFQNLWNGKRIHNLIVLIVGVGSTSILRIKNIYMQLFMKFFLLCNFYACFSCQSWDVTELIRYAFWRTCLVPVNPKNAILRR